MKVQDIMTTDVRACGPASNLAAICEIMFTGDCGMLPVLDDGGKVIGVITDRDISIAVGTRNRLASDIAVGEILRGEIHACTADDDILAALDIMQKAKVRRLPVIDGEGSLQGVVSLNDAAFHAEKGEGKKTPALSYEDIVKTYRAICEHSITRMEDQPLQAEKATSA